MINSNFKSKKEGIRLQKRTISLLCLIVFCLVIVGCGGKANMITSMDPRTNIIRDGHFHDYPNIKIGDAYDAFFSNPQWKYFKSDDGTEVVEFSGGCQFRNADVNVREQFILHTDDTFEAGALSFNDVPQIELINSALISTVFAAYENKQLPTDLKKSSEKQENKKSANLVENLFEVLNDDSLNVNQKNVDERQYIVNNHKIGVAVRKITNTDDFLTITKDESSVYNQRISNEQGYRIFRIKENHSQREFFIVDMMKNSLLMGYDEKNNSWNIYVSSDSYENTVNGEPWTSAINGRLYLTYQQDGVRTKKQVYRLEWDDNKGAFDCIDEGIQ